MGKSALVERRYWNRLVVLPDPLILLNYSYDSKKKRLAIPVSYTVDTRATKLAMSKVYAELAKKEHRKFAKERYDCCCPMMSAWDLHKAWPEAEFKVVPDAGHSANEPGIAAELVAANEKLKNIIKNA
ncbi:hypothetical protein L2E82_33641 [Cichorium intybus]|uniref:Uncharacterized protein n=1 Tax=Cichorium intybus TaxID=13427 RepID=A0ACB9BKQ7_CICIN|nr:hypothetical protein L2E82_33641 [Cichorium intybus]